MNDEPRADSFVDTNILVYAFGDNDEARSPVARALLRDLMTAGRLRTSTQVLQELFVVLTRKARKLLTAGQALRYLDEVARWPVIASDYGAVRQAAELSGAASLSFWDALLVVAAARSGAALLYTEDLQHGQKILGVEIVNPFRARDCQPRLADL
jgi:predicted nucleic acid-binding protein